MIALLPKLGNNTMHKTTWPTLSDILEGKISVNNFSVSDYEISFELNEEKHVISFMNMNKKTLEQLVKFYTENPNESHTHGINHSEHCASYVSSIITHSTETKWLPFQIIEKWKIANTTGYHDCIEFVLQNGNAQSISLLLNAAKGAISLNATTHQRAINEVLLRGTALSIALALNSSNANLTTITMHAQKNPNVYHFDKLSSAELRPYMKSLLDDFLAKIRGANAVVVSHANNPAAFMPASRANMAGKGSVAKKIEAVIK
jgi:hypothetical protein